MTNISSTKPSFFQNPNQVTTANILFDRQTASKFSAQDLKHAASAEQNALENTAAGEEVIWQNKITGNTGTVIAAQPYQVGAQNCRQYNHIATIDGTSYETKGGACKSSNGKWIPLV